MDYYNIYTGKKVNNFMESIGCYAYKYNDKMIYVDYNGKKIKFEFETNKEYSLENLKFIICSPNKKSKEMVILFDSDIQVISHNERLRQDFTQGWTYFKVAYNFNLNETLEFECEDNKIKIFID